MAVIFPLVFLSVVLLMQLCLWLSLRVRTKAVCEQAMSVFAWQRQQGKNQEEACQAAEEYLEMALSSDHQSFSWSWKLDSGFLQETDALYVTAEYSFLIPMSYQTVQKKQILDPVTFRNRADLLYEKLKEFTDETSS